MWKSISAVAAIALAAFPAAAARPAPDAQLQKLLAGRVAGKPVSCITPSGSSAVQIIAGRALVYRDGGRLYVNVPRTGADRLRDDDLLVTRTNGSQLCRIDSVQLYDRVAWFPRGFVVLGDFVPYARPRAAD